MADKVTRNRDQSGDEVYDPDYWVLSSPPPDYGYRRPRHGRAVRRGDCVIIEYYDLSGSGDQSGSGELGARR